MLLLWCFHWLKFIAHSLCSSYRKTVSTRRSHRSWCSGISCITFLATSSSFAWGSRWSCKSHEPNAKINTTSNNISPFFSLASDYNLFPSSRKNSKRRGRRSTRPIDQKTYQHISIPPNHQYQQQHFPS